MNICINFTLYLGTWRSEGFRTKTQ